MTRINVYSRMTNKDLIFICLVVIAGILDEALSLRNEKIKTRVELICELSNSTQTVEWISFVHGGPREVATCGGGQVQCTYDSADTRYIATRNFTISKLSVTYPKPGNAFFMCMAETDVIQSYALNFFDPTDIKTPECHVNPIATDIPGKLRVKYSCHSSTASQQPHFDLAIRGDGYKFQQLIPLNSSIIAIADNDARSDTGNISCELSIPGTDISKSCYYPTLVNVSYSIEDNTRGKDGIIFECEFESQNVDVSWRSVVSEGDNEDITNRSWTKDGGRSLLIWDITPKDDGTVVECRTYRPTDGNQSIIEIGYTEIVVDVLKGNTTDSKDLDLSTKTLSIYMVLTLLFLTLWLTTCVVGGIIWFCQQENMKPSMLTSGTALVPINSRFNVTDERGTPSSVRTGAIRDSNTLNINNSAHNPAFEPEVNNTEENIRNRQSNNEGHLYFTLEKSSPSPVNSLLSTARWERPATNPASLNQPQSSHSQCYETVGEPNKGATCSYDLGEYAEVGYGKGPSDLGEYAQVGGRFQGKGPPVLSDRPSIRKKPGREKVKENDISSLYSKVTK